jgi:alpha-N-arabinofuranosidase
MYRPHMGARLVPMDLRTETMAVQVPNGVESMPALSGSASVRDNRVAVTLTNPSLENPVATRIRFPQGARPSEARATILTHEDMRAGNTFDEPDTVRPAEMTVRTNRQTVQLNVPKQSVVAVEIRIT